MADRSQIAPIFVDSWNQLGIEVRLRGPNSFRGDGVSLDKFHPVTNVIEPESIGHSGLRNHVARYRERYQVEAGRKRKSLLRSGFLTAQEARVHAIGVLASTEVMGALAGSLAARFRELIVDEGQDCNPEDLQLLSWLRNAGLDVSFVCDPDQAIYEFRDGDIAATRRFQDLYAPEHRLPFTGSFRCSPPIARLAATLRANGATDTSLGDSASVDWPVQVFAYGSSSFNSAISDAFTEAMTTRGVSPSNSIILAHSRRSSQIGAVGFPSGDTKPSSRAATVAKAVADLWSEESSSKARERALVGAEKLLLEFMGITVGANLPSQVAEREGIDRRSLRRTALEFLVSIPRTCGSSDQQRSDWIDAVRYAASRLELQVPSGTSAGRFFPKPSSAGWSRALQNTARQAVRYSTIHEAKGREYDGVCVVIPPDRDPQNKTSSLLNAWIEGHESEARRVIYVGVTRARLLVSMALPLAFADRLASFLHSKDVPVERHEI